METFATLAGLFAAAFLAATVVPAQSEALLVGLLLAGRVDPAVLVAVASAGNVLGSALNYALGRVGARWLPVSEAGLARARRHYRRWGRWSLLASWVPIVGDPITVAAGAMRERLPVFLALVGFAKTARYVVLAAVTFSYV